MTVQTENCVTAPVFCCLIITVLCFCFCFLFFDPGPRVKSLAHVSFATTRGGISALDSSMFTTRETSYSRENYFNSMRRKTTTGNGISPWFGQKGGYHVSRLKLESQRAQLVSHNTPILDSSRWKIKYVFFNPNHVSMQHLILCNYVMWSKKLVMVTTKLGFDLNTMKYLVKSDLPFSRISIMIHVRHKFQVHRRYRQIGPTLKFWSSHGLASKKCMPKLTEYKFIEMFTWKLNSGSADSEVSKQKRTTSEVQHAMGRDGHSAGG